MSSTETEESGIVYRVGDLFKLVDFDTPTIKLIPHCCNDANGYGSGFVAALNRQWPVCKNRYHEWYRLGIDLPTGRPFKLGQFQSVKVYEKDPFSQTFVLNMIGQHGTISPDNPKPVKYAALAECIKNIGLMLRQYSARHGQEHPIEVITVKFGSDLAGGDWNIIEEMVIDHWLSNEVRVTVFSLD